MVRQGERENIPRRWEGVWWKRAGETERRVCVCVCVCVVCVLCDLCGGRGRARPSAVLVGQRRELLHRHAPLLYLHAPPAPRRPPRPPVSLDRPLKAIHIQPGRRRARKGKVWAPTPPLDARARRCIPSGRSVAAHGRDRSQGDASEREGAAAGEERRAAGEAATA